MADSPRAFVLRNTRLRPVPGLAEIRLHLADEVLPLWRAVQLQTNDPDAPLPYWAFAWAGGLAICRYLGEHPDVDEVDTHVRSVMQTGLDELAAERRFPILG